MVLTKKERFIESWYLVIHLWFAWFGRDYVFEKCGHKAKRRTLVTTEEGVPLLYQPKEKDYCPKCWLEVAIKCPWCNLTILPGFPITLYTPRPDFVIPDHAQSFCDMGGHRVRLVGCPRPSCADTGADYAGTWEMPGKVVTCQTAYEMIMGDSVSVQR